MIRIAASLSLLLSLCACAARMERAEVLHLPTTVDSGLRCPYRLGQIVDARSTTEVGMLGKRTYAFPDIAASVREALGSVGWSRDADASSVTISIQKLYLSALPATVTGVAAFEIRPHGASAFVVRGQSARVNWNSSTSDAMGILGAAVGDARMQLVARLNASCRTPATAGP
ncbi:MULTISPECIES: hypothetical protein [Xanthomonas]|uniref:ABC-type transport auxiliary lipoprotein component domain-containing protein n=1 Tax=Xanthomonas rydalmerensis TaxID=3046274 RepID=A0ABZ0JL44_9XANT|nr:MULTISPECIES: hypothetical protein [unclassified Xanthomonas]MBB5941094.1 hypothetical protein [Xanthomonas sp. 3307]WOS39723.1 hypothetical protein QN243_15020 [Xanthomonas sp. DM-2023]WOS43907.1 hypothetical protein QN242_15020 [Xanthomonas sp. DM-2023]WOS48087.1 hypothetical protein QN240_15020 [Xanthomonas sp. DM-2023]WOS52266.1 hypothetical protein QN244_15020 [Xanthomonas sp. DM-2023]